MHPRDGNRGFPDFSAQNILLLFRLRVCLSPHRGQWNAEGTKTAIPPLMEWAIALMAIVRHQSGKDFQLKILAETRMCIADRVIGNESMVNLCHTLFSWRSIDRRTAFSARVWLPGRAVGCIWSHMLYYVVEQPPWRDKELDQLVKP